MPDLPSLIQNALEDLEAELVEMRRGGTKEQQKPHKLIMLLSVIDLAEAGLIQENKIYLSQQLIRNFEKYFRQVSDRDDWCQPGPPFFHLRSSSFWKHQLKKGREQAYGKLATSGGGLKRIQDNIEYAYLSGSAYQVFSNASARQELKDFIIVLLGKDNSRLKTVFHESFSLSRPSLQQILSVATKTKDTYIINQGQRKSILRVKTNLGTNYVKAMPRYAVGTGLLGANYKLTTFGKLVQKHDTLLEQESTQWLMHYHLSAPQGPGPAFWHELVMTRFRSGNEFTTSEIAGQISQFFQRTEGKPLAERSARSTATVFLGTYTKADGLGNLKFLQGISEDRYRVNDDLDPPPSWSVAYAILDFWEAQLQGRKTINLDELTDENSVANLFMIGAGKIAAVLQKMQAEGYVDLFRVSPPYQVVLLRPDSKAILEKLYAHE